MQAEVYVRIKNIAIIPILPFYTSNCGSLRDIGAACECCSTLKSR